AERALRMRKRLRRVRNVKLHREVAALDRAAAGPRRAKGPVVGQHLDAEPAIAAEHQLRSRRRLSAVLGRGRAGYATLRKRELLVTSRGQARDGEAHGPRGRGRGRCVVFAAREQRETEEPKRKATSHAPVRNTASRRALLCAADSR